MKRISQNRDLFEANPSEPITVTVEAVNTPYQVTFSDLESGGRWTSLQSPTPARPIEKRTFAMPSRSREFFVIVYSFPPDGHGDPNAKYTITFAGAAGSSDGPNDVLPPVSGDIDDLPYEFRLPRSTTLLLASGTSVVTPAKPTRRGRKV
jgi:hypothetical protein